MKCDNCEHRKFHSAGSWWSVAEGNDDPYNYEYCYKGYWCGDNSIPQCEEAEAVGMKDQFIDCKNFKPAKDKLINY
jgi:hypothetical protein